MEKNYNGTLDKLAIKFATIIFLGLVGYIFLLAFFDKTGIDQPVIFMVILGIVIVTVVFALLLALKRMTLKINLSTDILEVAEFGSAKASYNRSEIETTPEYSRMSLNMIPYWTTILLHVSDKNGKLIKTHRLTGLNTKNANIFFNDLKQ
ncbi:hypothetical protein AwErysi_07560 [Erysipelotrichaceae bacterium]|nr:hypothetical protein AwErysi_07560 [Erysipelotrichaceae bacterium]